MLSLKNISLFFLFGFFFILKADDQSEIDFAQQLESNILRNDPVPSLPALKTESTPIPLSSPLLDDFSVQQSSEKNSAENLAANISSVTVDSLSDKKNGTTVVSIGTSSAAVDKSSVQATLSNINNFNGAKDPAKQEAFLQSQLNILRNANNLLQKENVKLSNDPQIKLVPGTVLSQQNFGIVIAASGAIFIGLCALLAEKLHDLSLKTDNKISIKESVTANATKKMDEQIISLLNTYSEDELFTDNPDLETVKQISRMIDNFEEMRKDPQWKGQRNDMKYAFIESFNSTTRDLLDKQIKIEEQVGGNPARLKVLRNMQLTLEKFKAPAGHSVSADFKKAIMANVSSATKNSFDDALQKRIDKSKSQEYFRTPRVNQESDRDGDDTERSSDEDDVLDEDDVDDQIKRRHSFRNEEVEDDTLSRQPSSLSISSDESGSLFPKRSSSNVNRVRRFRK